MTSTQQHSALAAVKCDVAFDDLTRQIYATDASLYQVEPLAVAFPRSVKQASAIIEAACQAWDFDHPARSGNRFDRRRSRRRTGR